MKAIKTQLPISAQHTFKQKYHTRHKEWKYTHIYNTIMGYAYSGMVKWDCNSKEMEVCIITLYIICFLTNYKFSAILLKEWVPTVQCSSIFQGEVIWKHTTRWTQITHCLNRTAAVYNHYWTPGKEENTFQPTGCLLNDLAGTFSWDAMYWKREKYLLEACLRYHCFYTCLFINATTTDIRWASCLEWFCWLIELVIIILLFCL